MIKPKSVVLLYVCLNLRLDPLFAFFSDPTPRIGVYVGWSVGDKILVGTKSQL